VKLSDIGEFGLIERLSGILAPPAAPDLVLGIGDDAAVWRFAEEFLIATTDTMVDGVHFESGRTPWTTVGWKALATNVSDIAAMGGIPLFALVTLTLPSETEIDAVELIYVGLADCGREYGVTIVGGDTVRSPTLSITVALLGKAESRDGRPAILCRDSARPGDLIVVTGTLGDSAGGLRRLSMSAASDDPLVQRHLSPRPPLAVGRAAAEAGIECGIDVSDGLLQDIGHICERSRTGAVIRAADVPISDSLRAAYPDDALALACTGGEDYELVLVGDRDLLDAVASMIGIVPLTIIGEIVDDPERRVRVLDEIGEEVDFARHGWDAFR